MQQDQDQGSGKSADDLAGEQIVDISQNLSREPWCAGKVRSLTSGTRLYSFLLDRILSPQDHFALLGFNNASALCFRGISKRQAYELASESMAQPVVSLVCLCLTVVLKLGHRE